MYLLNIVVCSLLLLTFHFSHAMLVSTGSLHQIERFPSKYVDDKDVFVWLPDSYSNKKTYSVLYMHDGQMLFDASTTWNKQEWGVDEVAGQLIASGKVTDFIVVGVTNGDFRDKGKRMDEYFPQKPFQALSAAQQTEVLSIERVPGSKMFAGRIESDNYLKFLVQELKPYIDKTFSVKTDAKHTAIMGSSMGGLISMYAISEYPDVFGAAACISTHWPGAIPSAVSGKANPVPQAFFDYMAAHLPDPSNHRLYFDLGTETLDQYYPELQKQADKVIQQRGYSDANWTTQVFKGAAHDEISWNARLHVPLMFLFGKN
ncbi:alpha/beta hydrolase [Paraneptunicella aestuarii]|uniref:alpha/beta hydrolase n=1 Tax=Paraneptunicella aestuarii TaxID=2831148 RepID=UPI001E3021A3|nr:alpha/beta hydrolase-fold protein [Paraneptunicella aestuarii]UAA38247.1 alpha/beta hydrolase [Paraneptunicella aestuarii]